jgi:hypothetical protein
MERKLRNREREHEIEEQLQRRPHIFVRSYDQRLSGKLDAREAAAQLLIINCFLGELCELCVITTDFG